MNKVCLKEFRVKKYFFCAAALLALYARALPVYAKSGDMGYFGGITEGRRLPKTTEILLDTAPSKTQTDFPYKEVVFLSGVPTEFYGLLRVTTSGGVTETEDIGSYTAAYRVMPNATSPTGVNIDRAITFNVNWRREGRQIIKDLEATAWREVITVGESSYSLDFPQSYFSVSIIEDHTAAVAYYRGDVASRAVYAGDVPTVFESYGSFYGYDCAWSNTETHRLDATVYNDSWQMTYQVRPSVAVSKELQYTQNEPTAISFEGNYKEVSRNDSGLFYDIFVAPPQLYAVPKTGRADIPSANVFEQLIAPEMSFLKGHYAESDIKKLFAMQVLGGEPKFYQPAQAITRAQFTAAVVKAIKLPLITQTAAKGKTAPVVMLFPDVPQSDPNFNYIMTAYKNGIAVGRTNGKFYADAPIERQEALVILLRSLGLENLGLDPSPITLFTDDAKIGDWAKRELYAAERIGLISQDENGAVKPKTQVTKAEAAALINRLIDYMRDELSRDYTDHIVNFVF